MTYAVHRNMTYAVHCYAYPPAYPITFLTPILMHIVLSEWDLSACLLMSVSWQCKAQVMSVPCIEFEELEKGTCWGWLSPGLLVHFVPDHHKFGKYSNSEINYFMQKKNRKMKNYKMQIYFSWLFFFHYFTQGRHCLPMLPWPHVTSVGLLSSIEGWVREKNGYQLHLIVLSFQSIYLCPVFFHFRWRIAKWTIVSQIYQVLCPIHWWVVVIRSTFDKPFVDGLLQHEHTDTGGVLRPTVRVQHLQNNQFS